MKEYTLLAVSSAVLMTLIDRFSGIRLTSRMLFWIYITIMFAFKFLVNGYLTWRPIVIYGEEHYLGLRIWTIPVEDFFFGYGMILLAVMVWEGRKREEGRRKREEGRGKGEEGRGSSDKYQPGA